MSVYLASVRQTQLIIFGSIFYMQKVCLIMFQFYCISLDFNCVLTNDKAYISNICTLFLSIELYALIFSRLTLRTQRLKNEDS